MKLFSIYTNYENTHGKEDYAPDTTSTHSSQLVLKHPLFAEACELWQYLSII